MSALKSYPAWHVPSGLVTVLLLAIAGGAPVVAQTAPAKDTAADIARLVTVYPTFLDRVEGNVLIWKDGTRMTINEGRGSRNHETLLATADIKDMFFAPYPLGPPGEPPRPQCRPGPRPQRAVLRQDVRRLPNGRRRRWQFGRRRMAAEEVGPRPLRRLASTALPTGLAKVSSELDALPARFDQFLFPSAGTYVCRPIAGTTRVSAHGHGIAIDIATKRAHYWRWSGRTGRRRDPLSQL